MFDFDDGDGFWDMDTEDFALIAGIIGYAEEECEENARLVRESEKEQEEIDRYSNGECCDDFDNDFDDDPYQ